NRICAVNEVSRKFCSNQLTVEDAYQELKEIEADKLYTKRWKFLGLIGVSVFFAPIFGGGPLDMFGACIVGLTLALADLLISKVKLNDFFVNAFCSFVIAISATIVRKFLLPAASADVMIISSIMSLVPGVAFTTSIRDILNGDYASGSARMLEAIVVALAIAAGVGLGLVSWGVFWRWLT
ncbi:MAG: threonine/serine exporter family protein, partial [Lachnospiraceae bacterium]|nr:threonine/serine exporter family protein [Lachnospiraceae bacterium]